MQDIEIGIIVLLQRELEHLAFEKDGHPCTPADLVNHIRQKRPDLDTELVKESAGRVCQNRDALKSGDEREQLEAVDEAFDWHCRFLIETEGLEAIDPWYRHGYQNYEQIRSELNWGLLWERALEISKRYSVKSKVNWPFVALKEYMDLAISLGYTPEDMLTPWARGLTG